MYLECVLPRLRGGGAEKFSEACEAGEYDQRYVCQ
jgi:hypothetical protein